MRVRELIMILKAIESQSGDTHVYVTVPSRVRRRRHISRMAVTAVKIDGVIVIEAESVFPEGVMP